jgi:hypothetical protein
MQRWPQLLIAEGASIEGATEYHCITASLYAALPQVFITKGHALVVAQTYNSHI